MKTKLIKASSFYRKRMLLMIMRTFIFLLSTIAFSFNTENSLAQNKVTIDADKLVSVDEVFKIIMNQTDFNFIYPVGLFDNTPKTQLKKGVIKVDKLLYKSIGTTKFNIILSTSNNIVIKPKILDQQQEVSGVVVNEDGEPMPGVTVQIKGTQQGVITDFDGGFTIRITDETSVLVFSSLAYKKQEVVVGSRTNISVNMIPDLSGLDEVVVIGYGTSKVRDLTGTISNISAEEIKNSPLGSTAESLIQGKAAGVNVTIQSSSPTSPISVIVRGGSSLGGTNQPLWVLDGVPQYARSDDGNGFGLVEGNTNNIFYNLNLDDIKSIDILKDASATAIYGSRAKNGVILVTTKRGSYNTKPVFEVSTQIGISVADWNDFEYFTRGQYVDFISTYAPVEVIDGDGRFTRAISTVLDEDAFLDLDTSEYDADSFSLLPRAFNTNSQVTDWLELLTQSPITTTHSFSVRGGSENTSYSTSFGYEEREGVVRTGVSERYSGRFNFDTKFNKNYKFGLNLSGSTRESDDKDRLVRDLKRTRPDFPAFNPDGTLFIGDDGATQNPLLELQNINRGVNVLFQGSAFVEARFLKDFLFRTSYSNTYNNNKSTSFRGDGSIQLRSVGERTVSLRTLSSNIWENTLNYKKIFNGKHDVTALLGYTKERSFSIRYTLEASDFPDSEILTNFDSASSIDDITEFETENALVSQFARGQYQFDNRYIISGTVRRDGSSRFGRNRRWGTFPSGAIAWTITGEKFMQSEKMKKYIPFLKLRASLGITGGQDIGDFDHLSVFSGSTYNGNPSAIPGNDRDGGLGNRNLQWEETELLDIGLDFSLFNDRLSGTLGKYRKRSRDVLFFTDIATSSSFEEVPTNIAAIDNEGYEITLEYDVIRSRGGHNLSFNFNWATNETEVIEINGNVEELLFPDPDDAFQRLVEGGPTDEWWGFQTAGRFFNSNEEAASFHTRDERGQVSFNLDPLESEGDIIIIDQNGDGEITDEDRIDLGSASPDGFGGFGLNYSYKNFRINANFIYAYGFKRLWVQPFREANGHGFTNPTNSVVGESATVNLGDPIFPRPTLFGLNERIPITDTYLFDASYLRLSQVSVSYSIPREIFKNSPISGVNIRLQGSNLFTITDYPGIDPQGNFGDSQVGSGLGTDNSTFPQTQSYSLGVTVSLQ